MGKEFLNLIQEINSQDPNNPKFLVKRLIELQVYSKYSSVASQDIQIQILFMHVWKFLFSASKHCNNASIRLATVQTIALFVFRIMPFFPSQFFQSFKSVLSSHVKQQNNQKSASDSPNSKEIEPLSSDELSSYSTVVATSLSILTYHLSPISLQNFIQNIQRHVLISFLTFPESINIFPPILGHLGQFDLSFRKMVLNEFLMKTFEQSHWEYWQPLFSLISQDIRSFFRASYNIMILQEDQIINGEILPLFSQLLKVDKAPLHEVDLFQLATFSLEFLSKYTKDNKLPLARVSSALDILSVSSNSFHISIEQKDEETLTYIITKNQFTLRKVSTSQIHGISPSKTEGDNLRCFQDSKLISLASSYYISSQKSISDYRHIGHQSSNELALHDSQSEQLNLQNSPSYKSPENSLLSQGEALPLDHYESITITTDLIDENEHLNQNESIALANQDEPELLNQNENLETTDQNVTEQLDPKDNIQLDNDNIPLGQDETKDNSFNNNSYFSFSSPNRDLLESSRFGDSISLESSSLLSFRNKNSSCDNLSSLLHSSQHLQLKQSYCNLSCYDSRADLVNSDETSNLSLWSHSSKDYSNNQISKDIWFHPLLTIPSFYGLPLPMKFFLSVDSSDGISVIFMKLKSLLLHINEKEYQTSIVEILLKFATDEPSALFKALADALPKMDTTDYEFELFLIFEAIQKSLFKKSKSWFQDREKLSVLKYLQTQMWFKSPEAHNLVKNLVEKEKKAKQFEKLDSIPSPNNNDLHLPTERTPIDANTETQESNEPNVIENNSTPEQTNSNEQNNQIDSIPEQNNQNTSNEQNNQIDSTEQDNQNSSNEQTNQDENNSINEPRIESNEIEKTEVKIENEAFKKRFTLVKQKRVSVLSFLKHLIMFIKSSQEKESTEQTTTNYKKDSFAFSSEELVQLAINECDFLNPKDYECTLRLLNSTIPKIPAKTIAFYIHKIIYEMFELYPNEPGLLIETFKLLSKFKISKLPQKVLNVCLAVICATYTQLTGFEWNFHDLVQPSQNETKSKSENHLTGTLSNDELYQQISEMIKKLAANQPLDILSYEIKGLNTIQQPCIESLKLLITVRSLEAKTLNMIIMKLFPLFPDLCTKLFFCHTQLLKSKYIVKIMNDNYKLIEFVPGYMMQSLWCQIIVSILTQSADNKQKYEMFTSSLSKCINYMKKYVSVILENPNTYLVNNHPNNRELLLTSDMMVRFITFYNHFNPKKEFDIDLISNHSMKTRIIQKTSIFKKVIKKSSSYRNFTTSSSETDFTVLSSDFADIKGCSYSSFSPFFEVNRISLKKAHSYPINIRTDFYLNENPKPFLLMEDLKSQEEITFDEIVQFCNSPFFSESHIDGKNDVHIFEIVEFIIFHLGLTINKFKDDEKENSKKLILLVKSLSAALGVVDQFDTELASTISYVLDSNFDKFPPDQMIMCLHLLKSKAPTANIELKLIKKFSFLMNSYHYQGVLSYIETILKYKTEENDNITKTINSMMLSNIPSVYRNIWKILHVLIREKSELFTSIMTTHWKKLFENLSKFKNNQIINQTICKVISHALQQPKLSYIHSLFVTNMKLILQPLTKVWTYYNISLYRHFFKVTRTNDWGSRIQSCIPNLAIFMPTAYSKFYSAILFDYDALLPKNDSFVPKSLELFEWFMSTNPTQIGTLNPKSIKIYQSQIKNLVMINHRVDYIFNYEIFLSYYYKPKNCIELIFDYVEDPFLPFFVATVKFLREKFPDSVDTESFNYLCNIKCQAHSTAFQIALKNPKKIDKAISLACYQNDCEETNKIIKQIDIL